MGDSASVLQELKSPNSNFLIDASPETMALIGESATILPDVSFGNILVIRESDIVTPKNNPDGVKIQSGAEELNKGLGDFLKKHNFSYAPEETQNLAKELGAFEGTKTHFALGTWSVKKDGKPFDIIFIPDTLPDLKYMGTASNNETLANRLMTQSFDPYSMQTILLLHEAAHLNSDFMRGLGDISKEAMADKIALEIAKRLNMEGVLHVQESAMDLFQDVRTLSVLYAPSFGKETKIYDHDTGMILKKLNLTDSFNAQNDFVSEYEHLDAIQGINRTVHSFLGASARPSLDRISNQVDDPEIKTVLNEFWKIDFKNDPPSEAALNDLFDKMIEIARSPDIELEAAPAISDMIAREEKTNKHYGTHNMIIGHILATEHPELHYMITKALYENDGFEDLEKEYVGEFLKAYERNIPVSKQEASEAQFLTEVIRDTAIIYKKDEEIDISKDQPVVSKTSAPALSMN